MGMATPFVRATHGQQPGSWSVTDHTIPSPHHSRTSQETVDKSDYCTIAFLCLFERAKLVYGVSQGSVCPRGLVGGRNRRGSWGAGNDLLLFD